MAGNGVDGDMDSGIGGGKEGTVGAGVDGSSGWQIRQQMEALLRTEPRYP